MITALPSPPSTNDPSNFATKADALLAALPNFVTEANATAVAMNLNSTTDTSASSVAIGTGAKSFTVSTGKSFQPGMWLVVADAAAPSTNQMIGTITSYNSATGALVMNITAILGSGTKTAWVVSQSSSGGAIAGPLATSGITGAAASGANADITSLGNNTSTPYTTGGTATAFTITPVPAYTAYAAGMSAMVNFNAAAGAAPTIAWNGIATPPNLVKQLADGTYANIAANDFPINHRSRVTLLSAAQALVETMPPIVGARCAVYLATNQTMTSAATFYTLALDTEDYDIYSEFDASTYTFTAKNAGKYRITATASMSLGASGDWGELAIYVGVNRKKTARASTADTASAKVSPQVNAVLVLAAGDTVTIRGQYNSASASRSIDGTGLTGERTFMSIDRVG